MTELRISANFTIDDIHKIREYNAERTKGMTVVQLNEYYAKGSEPFIRLVEAKRTELHRAKSVSLGTD
jgi:hypothetical protein